MVVACFWKTIVGLWREQHRVCMWFTALCTSLCSGASGTVDNSMMTGIGMFHSFDITLQCSGLLPRRCGSKQGSDVSMSNVRVILRICEYVAVFADHLRCYCHDIFIYTTGHISPYLSSCLMISHRLRLLQQDYVNASPLSMSTVCKVC